MNAVYAWFQQLTIPAQAQLPPSYCVLEVNPSPCGGGSCHSTQEIGVINTAEMAEYVCQPLPAACQADRSCACVASTICLSIFSLCTNQPANNPVAGECPNC